MPLVRIDLHAGRPAAVRQAIGEAVHQAMVETLNVPPQDRFQVVAEHAPGDQSYDPEYLGIARGDGIVFVQITLNQGRSVEQKRALYARMAELLTGAGVRREDLLVSLVEVPRENWSFGDGVAQYAGS